MNPKLITLKLATIEFINRGFTKVEFIRDADTILFAGL